MPVNAVFDDDPTVPAETRITFSKKASMGGMLLAVPVLGLGIYLLVTNDIGGSIFMMVVVILIIYYFSRRYNNSTPQIILNAKGIETVNNPFYEWSVVKNERVRSVFENRSNVNYLLYEYYDTCEGKACLTDLDIDPERLEYLLRVYRTRSEKEHH